MFTVAERHAARDYVLELARADERVVAAAEVGSLALGGGDRWSDLDLTFGIRDGVGLTEILEDWTPDLGSRLDAVHLFDLEAGPAIYRVLMLPDHLQLDISVAPASRFRPTSPRFRLLFGQAQEALLDGPPSRADTLGWGVLWARHARVCVERGRWWQAEYCISNLRYCAMELACLRHGLPTPYARGSDDLPVGERSIYEGALAGSLERDELVGALAVTVTALLRECELGGDDERILRRLREMTP